jgi:hypothetical protein
MRLCIGVSLGREARRSAQEFSLIDATANRSQPAERRSPDALALILVRLFGERFGGATAGKFRISRKFLRQLAGRRKLSDGYFVQLAEEMFEAGFVFVDCESYFIVLSQKQFASYRRVTAAAVNKVLSLNRSDDQTAATFGEDNDGSEYGAVAG